MIAAPRREHTSTERNQRFPSQMDFSGITKCSGEVNVGSRIQPIYVPMLDGSRFTANRTIRSLNCGTSALPLENRAAFRSIVRL